RRRRAGEVLLPQELIERDELPAIVVAAPVGEPRGSLQVVGNGEGQRAARTIEIGGDRAARAPGLADELKESDHGLRREPHALELVEPEQAAGLAGID